VNNATETDPAHAFAPEFGRRFALILASIGALVAARFRFLGPLTVPLWARLSRASQRIARLLAHLEAGTLRPRPPAQPPATPRVRPATPRPFAARAWLIRSLGWEAAAYASQLEHLLTDPKTASLLAAVPSAARTLRPLCRLLGITLPSPLQTAVANPRRAPRPCSPRPATPTKRIRKKVWPSLVGFREKIT
jgi:HAMP domain-containing protein